MRKEKLLNVNVEKSLPEIRHGQGTQPMTEIKAGDYVIVAGEANEVFEVSKVEGKSVILTTGWAEPIDKCLRIPRKFHNKISKMSSMHLDFEVVDHLYKKDIKS